jgi:hypothetical protein
VRLRAHLRPAEARLWLGRAAATDDTVALRSLIAVFDASGRTGASAEWLQDAARRGNAYALRETIRRHRRDDPERWLRFAVEIGAPGSVEDLAIWLDTRGRREEADRLRRFGVDPGGATASEWALPDQRMAIR